MSPTDLEVSASDVLNQDDPQREINVITSCLCMKYAGDTVILPIPNSPPPSGAQKPVDLQGTVLDVV